MRLSTSLALVTLLSTLASAPAWAADKAPPAPPPKAEILEEDEFQKPPPGSAEEQALWERGRQVSRDIRATRSEAYRLQSVARAAKLLERLDAVAKAKPAEADGVRGLRQRLLADWKANHAFMARRWPVNTVRGCGYPLLAYESALRVKADRGPASDVPSARTDLQACIDKADTAAKGMDALNKTFAATVDEAHRRLVELEPARPPAPKFDPAEAAARAEQARRAKLSPAAAAGQVKKQD